MDRGRLSIVSKTSYNIGKIRSGCSDWEIWRSKINHQWYWTLSWRKESLAFWGRNSTAWKMRSGSCSDRRSSLGCCRFLRRIYYIVGFRRCRPSTTVEVMMPPRCLDILPTILFQDSSSHIYLTGIDSEYGLHPSSTLCSLTPRSRKKAWTS